MKNLLKNVKYCMTFILNIIFETLNANERQKYMEIHY